LGRAAAAKSPLLRHPWVDQEAHCQSIDLRRLAIQLIGAAVQVQRVGSPEAQRAARDVLVDSRRRLYRLLAEDDGGDLGDLAEAMAAIHADAPRDEPVGRSPSREEAQA